MEALKLRVPRFLCKHHPVNSRPSSSLTVVGSGDHGVLFMHKIHKNTQTLAMSSSFAYPTATGGRSCSAMNAIHNGFTGFTSEEPVVDMKKDDLFMQRFVESLTLEGVEEVLICVAEPTDKLYKALVGSPAIVAVHVKEWTSVHAVSMFALVSGVPAVVYMQDITSKINDIKAALLDGLPIVAITGKISSDLDSCTKRVFTLQYAAEMPKVLREAFHTALSGDRGVVVVCIPTLNGISPRHAVDALEGVVRGKDNIFVGIGPHRGAAGDLDTSGCSLVAAFWGFRPRREDSTIVSVEDGKSFLASKALLEEMKERQVCRKFVVLEEDAMVGISAALLASEHDIPGVVVRERRHLEEDFKRMLDFPGSYAVVVQITS